MISSIPLFKAFQKPSSPPDEAARLRKNFQDDGWVVVDLRIPDFDALAAEIIAGVTDHYKGVDRILNAWRWCAPVKKLASVPRVLDTLEILYQRKAFPFQTLNFPVGTKQPAHSDCIHFSADPPEKMAGVWVALEDTDERNGALFVCPGSHKLPVYNMQDFGLRSTYEDYRLYEQALERIIQEKGFVKKELYVKKGQAVIWSANLLHGGSRIQDRSRTRHSQATHYYFKGCKNYYCPMLSDLQSGLISDHPAPGFRWIDRWYPHTAKFKRSLRRSIRWKTDLLFSKNSF